MKLKNKLVLSWKKWHSKKISEKIFDCLLYVFMIFVIIVTLYPFINILAISLNDSLDSVKGGITLFPRKFTLANYEHIFKHSNLINALQISLLRTVIGTALGIIASSMLAYTISRRDFMFRGFVTLVFVLTMYVTGGLIPDYMLMRQLGLIGKFTVYILPGLISAYNVIVLRSYMDALPMSLQESAKIDGANDFVIFYKIIFPLCKPAIAVVALFIAVGQWNAWYDTYVYATNTKALSTLQYEMMKILSATSAAQGAAQRASMTGGAAVAATISPESVRMAMTIIATVPIIMVYPFIQGYFVKGMTLGAVKS